MNRLLKKIRKVYIAVAIIISSLVAPSLVMADFQALSIVGNPLTTSTAPYLMLTGLTGQSACSISILAPFGGSIAVEGLYPNTTNAQWTGPLLVASPDGTSTVNPITAAGSYVFNCGSMLAIRADGTSATGTPAVTLNASGGVSRVISSGVNSGATIVNGSAPITVTTVGNVSTVGLTTPITIPEGGTNNTSLPSGCLTSNGTQVSSTGFACGSGSGTVTAVTGSGNIASSGGTTPNITITNSPTFTGTVTAGTSIIDTPLTPGNCLQAGTAGLLTTTSFACGSGSGTVTNVGAIAPLSSSGGTTPNIACVTCVIAVNGTGNISSTGGTAPTVSITSAPTFSGQVTAASYKATNLTTGDCLESISGVITSTSTGCPSGSLGGVTAGNDIVVSTPNPNAPTVSVTNSPTFSGVLSLTGSGNVLNAGTGDIVQSGTPGTTSINPGSFAFVATGGATNSSLTGESFDILSSVNGGGSFGVSTAIWDLGLTAGDCVGSPNNVTYGAPTLTSNVNCVASLTAGSNITLTGSAATPTVAVTAAPTFSNVTDSALTSGNCLQASTAGLLTTTGSPCSSGSGTLTGITAGNDIVVTGTAPSPTVAVTNAPTFTGTATANAVTSTTTVSADSGTVVMGTTANVPFDWCTVSCSNIIYTTVTGTVSGVTSTDFGILNKTTTSQKMALDDSGDLGLAGYLASGTLTSGRCLQASTNGQIVSTSAACTAASGTTAVVGSVAGSTVTQTITAPATATYVRIEGIGPGTGGAGGGSVGGGGGGGGGSYSLVDAPVSSLVTSFGTSTLIVSIPTGTAGAAGAVPTGSSPTAAGAATVTCGGTTVFSTAPNQTAPTGGTASAGGTAGSSGGHAQSTGFAGNGGAGGFGAVGGNGSSSGSYLSGGGGGGGGGLTFSGGTGGSSGYFFFGGITATVAAANGRSSPTIAVVGGGGGGGGTGGGTTAGGNGGSYGAGGAGGAADATTPGTGGNGGPGIVVVTFY
jgi:hypothetical protein